MKYGKSKKNGISFIELLFSSAILFILLIGTAQLTIHAMMAKKWSDLRLDSSTIIFSRLEQLKSRLFSGNELEEEKNIEITTGQASNQQFIVEWNLRSSPEGMKCIELRCFPPNSPQRESRLLLYLSDELGF